MLDAEADQLCGAGRYERSQARQDTRAGGFDAADQRQIYAKIEAWRNRRIEGEHPSFYLDGIVMGGPGLAKSAMSLCWWPAESIRKVSGDSGICEGAKVRLVGVPAPPRRPQPQRELITTDACRGLMESATEYLPDAQWLRCMVHFYRNAFSPVPATRVREAAPLRYIAGTAIFDGFGLRDLRLIKRPYVHVARTSVMRWDGPPPQHLSAKPWSLSQR